MACGVVFVACALSDGVVCDCAASVVDKAPRATNIDMMDRRTFMLLTGAAAVLPVRRPRPLRALGNLRFDLDDQRRLALWYNGPDRSVPLLRNAALGVWIGDTLATLADLQDVSVGNRRRVRSEEHTSELQSLAYLVCRLLLEKKKAQLQLHLPQLTIAAY